jgi:hypothetical protein
VHPLRTEPLQSRAGPAKADAVQAILFSLSLINLTLVCGGLCFPDSTLNVRWLDGMLVLLAAATTLNSLALRLPIQNVAGLAITLSLTALILGSLYRLTGLAFGPKIYPDGEALTPLHPFPWLMAGVWLTVILNARGVARLILRPWREAHWYGLYLLGASVTLVTLFALGFEPFAVRIKHYYSWYSTGPTAGWFGVPWLCIFGWAAGSFVALVVATPWFIEKKPVKAIDSFHPLAVWSLLNLLLVAGAVLGGLWPVALVEGVGNLLLLAVLWVNRKPHAQ